MSEAAAQRIVSELRAAGFQALFAGGAVRDRLLGVAAKDYDVATDATPEAVMGLFPRHSAVGAKFGVVLVHLDAASIEVATFRTDASYRDGRHPEKVAYATDPREDVARRDFTINGLLLEPETGEVLDFVGGRADLDRGLIRAIGDPDRRFHEDRLRMLRAVRFAARLGFEIEAGTLAAIRAQAAAIVEISPERIRDELLKMLTEGHARRAFELLDATKLLPAILPEVAAMRGVEQPPQFHPEGDVWIHTLLLLEGLKPGCAPTLALGALLHDVGKPPTFERAPDRIRFNNHAAIGARMAARICDRLRLANHEKDAVVALVAEHMKFPELPRMRVSTRKRFLRQPGFDQLLELLRLDTLASHGDLELYKLARDYQVQLPPEHLRPPRLLTGRDLREMGYRPGPEFKAILTEVEDAQLEGQLTDPDAARKFVRERHPVPH
ncbi:MAG TPA: CCA tRNA nucleotidyltransferase [Terriglobales bacterium]|nr:CCA tRNA nucleotidyltransferase [Terriglobales bacterium]